MNILFRYKKYNIPDILKILKILIYLNKNVFINNNNINYGLVGTYEYCNDKTNIFKKYYKNIFNCFKWSNNIKKLCLITISSN